MVGRPSEALFRSPLPSSSERGRHWIQSRNMPDGSLHARRCKTSTSAGTTSRCCNCSFAAPQGRCEQHGHGIPNAHAAATLLGQRQQTRQRSGTRPRRRLRLLAVAGPLRQRSRLHLRCHPTSTASSCFSRLRGLWRVEDPGQAEAFPGRGAAAGEALGDAPEARGMPVAPGGVPQLVADTGKQVVAAPEGSQLGHDLKVLHGHAQQA
mmetsp:Transcript_8300/g.21255  ORF Transcript_8300/g.21255 Transcript_8300/m.21255 type:complete len:208 (-) Transcript_8300:958-1581(-)